MDETAAVIRNQMDQTRTDLSDQFERLEQRVASDLNSTGAVVTDILGTVRDTAQSVRHAVDFRAHIGRHPWIAFGGAVALGYFATRLMSQSKSTGRALTPRLFPQGASSASGPRRPAEPIPQPATPQGPSPQPSHQQGVRNILSGMLREVAARGAPLVLDYLTAQRQPAPPTAEVSAGHTSTPSATSSQSRPTTAVQPPRESDRQGSRPVSSLRALPRHG